MATAFEIPQHRYRYPWGGSLPLAPPEKRLRKRLGLALVVLNLPARSLCVSLPRQSPLPRDNEQITWNIEKI